MKIKELTIEQFKALIEETIEAKLKEIFGDPDEGLEAREEIIEKLKAQRNSRKKRTPMDEIIKELGIEIG